MQSSRDLPHSLILRTLEVQYLLKTQCHFSCMLTVEVRVGGGSVMTHIILKRFLMFPPRVCKCDEQHIRNTAQPQLLTYS